MEGVFAERVTLQELILARLEAELFKLAPRKPLTLECDEIKITYSVCENVLIFEVSYDLRANGREGEEAWRLSCAYIFVYAFRGEKPVQADVDGLAPTVLKLAHDYLRELAHWQTLLAGLPPLVVDVGRIPTPERAPTAA